MSDDELWETDNEEAGGHPSRGGRDSACAVWDFTLNQDQKGDILEPEKVTARLQEKCKRWGCQLEMSNQTGYIHYQGRVSLKDKQRLSTVGDHLLPGWSGVHFSRTSKACASGDNFYNYVMKLDTCVAGPWCDKDPEFEEWPEDWLPEPLENRPWQDFITNSLTDRANRRTINFVWDPTGGSGKSTLYAMARKKIGNRAFRLDTHLPVREMCLSFTNYILEMPKKIRLTKATAIFVDMPRSGIEDKKLWYTLELIKSGEMTETRYSTKRVTFMKPHIWVFANWKPELKALTRDRWNLYKMINGDMIVWNPQEPQESEPEDMPLDVDDDLDLDPVFE